MRKGVKTIFFSITCRFSNKYSKIGNNFEYLFEIVKTISKNT